MMMNAAESIHRFQEQRVLVIGDAMLDSYLEGTATRLCSEGPVPVVRKTDEVHAPGGAANTAANLRALGADVCFLGLVGRDPAGDRLREALRACDVDDRWLVEDAAVGTLHKLRILANDQYVVRFDEGETDCCSPEGQEQLVAQLEEVFPRCDLVVVSDYAYGVLSDALIRRLQALRAGRPCPLVVDSKQLGRYRHAGATVVTPNQSEARRVVEPDGHHDGVSDLVDLERIGRRLLALVDAEYAAITLAGDGVLLLGRRGVARHIPADPVPHAADIGAGDTFTAALALALAAGATCEEAAQLGIDAASIAVTRRRTAVVHQWELLRRVGLRDRCPPLDVEILVGQLEARRQRGQRIVFTNGVFDILHAGHIDLLRRAKQLGDVLIVGVNSDASTRRLKGRSRPINGEADRLALVAALDVVDHAILFEEDTPVRLIRALRPHVHVKGGDYTPEALAEAAAVREAGGRIVILPLIDGLSTSGVIGRIRALTPEAMVAAP
jgi:D-beta-D-heptose 7-phosphate kinase / D-beta-D-heptose 1-phosphate adenosyltransferase